MIFINDLRDSVVSDISLYSDDTKVSKDVQLDSDSIVVQNDLFLLQDWPADWLLLFHPDKCIVLRMCLPWQQNIEPRIFHVEIRWNLSQVGG